MGQNRFTYASSTVVALAVLTGLYTVGGPTTGRHQKLDAKRLSDLNIIAAKLVCAQGIKTDARLPTELNNASLGQYCKSNPDSVILTDPETNDPYTYIRINDYEFSVCAKFKDPEYAALMRQVSYSNKKMYFDNKSGCINSTQ